ncbi:hypothetical protein LZ554_009151 [Drepanopeziza brunnea f. sp. 'monogermtubi']|nr:hypothetical protein LZ554_009151 [Drepanopeziza brunnea f. sp. 'monogermtubi']
MDAQPSSANSQYQYLQATQWSRLVRRNSLAAVGPSLEHPASRAVTSQLPSRLDLIPILLPQQPSYHLVQLAVYNRLISAGTAARLQSSPLPPLLSPQHIQAVPGQRSSSSGTTARINNLAARGGHGNKEQRKSSIGERALITEKEVAATMPGKKAELSQLPIRSHPPNHRPTLSQLSNSVPSTPHQRARDFAGESRETSPTAANNHSPRSAYSESNIPLPPKPHPKRIPCKYETAMAGTRRRMPYNLGDELLEKVDDSKLKAKLTADDEKTLTAEMEKMYNTLLPTPKSDRNREAMLKKLEDLFNREWPGHDIRAHVFGSSGNLLCTDESDVDICITTEWDAMPNVCMVADLLAKNGMEKVLCIGGAKIPIVKIWDPELKLACDMNVNNPLALENTRMIKTYVQIDPRVRPLAMIIKHWTKERVVNDAAFGCTLSSYTWICMIIYFLQNRKPPILPALHQRPQDKLPRPNGDESAFADDLRALAGFGKDNPDSLGDLLFQFFRYYSHEFDYENTVISVRSGTHVSKEEKGWHCSINNRLCVEEPFNIGRNLGNTADDISFRGLHMELRRAFDLISEGNLLQCCEKYVFPKVEEKFFTRATTKKSSAVIMRSISTSSGRGGGRNGGGHRGNRNNSQSGRNGNSNRRSSAGAFDQNHNPAYVPGMPPNNFASQEAWLQRQAQAQLHNDLYATYSVLQAQENNLRLQLYAQGLQNQAYAQSQAQAQAQAQGQANGSTSKQPSATQRNRTSSFEQAPLTAPLRPDMYFYPLQYPPNQMYYQSPTTNPSSPSLSAATPDPRRSMQRSTATDASGHGQPNSALRSQSQPATRSGSSPLALSGGGLGPAGLGIHQSARPGNGNAVPSFISDENPEPAMDSSFRTLPPPLDGSPPKEYVGYYVNDPTQLWRRQHHAMPPPIPTFGDLGQVRAPPRRLSTEQLPQSILDRLKRPSRSPSPLGHERSYSMGAPFSLTNPHNGVSNTNLRALNSQTPAVVNGSNPLPLSIPNWRASISEGCLSEGRVGDLVVGPMDSLSQASRTESDTSGEHDMPGNMTPRDVRQDGRTEPPMVVNGSTPLKKDAGLADPVSTASNGHVPLLINVPNGFLPVDLSGSLRLSPNGRNRSTRQNGGVSPLDLAQIQDHTRDDLNHLSPVYETRSPSPTANRKFEPVERKITGTTNGATWKGAELYAKFENAGPKSGQSNGQSNGQINGLHSDQAAISKVNGHTRASKSEGTAGNWQKITKSKKKAEGKSIGEGHPQSEKFPAHVNERKGG